MSFAVFFLQLFLCGYQLSENDVHAVVKNVKPFRLDEQLHVSLGQFSLDRECNVDELQEQEVNTGELWVLNQF